MSDLKTDAELVERVRAALEESWWDRTSTAPALAYLSELEERMEEMRRERDAARTDLIAVSSVRDSHWQARVRELEQALREARPYVFNRITPENDEWRSQTATGVLARIDAALDAQPTWERRVEEARRILREIAHGKEGR